MAAAEAGAATIDEGDRGPVSIITGETLTIDLKPASSGSTGYHWRVTKKPRAAVLRLKSNRISSDGKTQRLTFVGRGEGATPLTVKYLPPGRHAKAKKTFKAVVIVNKPIPKVDCSPRYEDLIALSSKAQVFTVRRTVLARYAGGARRVEYTAWYGCELGQDTAYQLPGPERPEDIGADSISNLTLRGSKVGYVYTAGCPFGPASDGACPDRAVPVVEAQDLGTGALIRSIDTQQGPTPGNTVTGLVVSSTGGLAWIEEPTDVYPTRVFRSDDVPPTTSLLDDDDGEPGAIDRDSLGFDGTDVTWLKAGERHHAPLR